MAKQPAKPQPKPQVKSEPKKEVVLTPLIPDSIAKKVFWGFAAILVVVMVFVSRQYGISGDENFHREYGHRVLNFYTSLGQDSTCTMASGPDSLMRFYGGFYDGSAAMLSKTFSSANEWSVRHAWNSLFGFVAILCAALVAVEIAGWQAGLIALLFMAFSPRFFGESMNNPKDITMAAGYMLTYVFILKFLKQLPKPNWKVALGLGLSIGMAMGIRIGGLLLIPYLFLFYGLAMLQLYGWGGLLDFSKFKENIWPSLKWVLFSAGLGYFLALVFWPFGLVSPIHNPLEALGVAEKFPVTMRILFDGKHIFTAQQGADGKFVSLIPWNYIPQWFLISTPLFGLIGAFVSAVLIPQMNREKKLLYLGFVYFTLFFPIAYVIYKHSVLYDAMRHFFFVYPSIIILSALTFNYFINRFPKAVKYGVVALMLVLVALPARFMFANHPNEYVYFNELVGGIKGAANNYETDYYMNSVKQCADWLKEHENLKTNGRKTLIYSNAIAPTYHYFIHDTTDVLTGYVSYRNRSNVPADYEILYSRFVDRPLLMNGCFPPEQAIYVVYADGVPLSCVLKKVDKGDYEGNEAVKRNDFATAIAKLEPYCQKYPKNDAALQNLGLAYLSSVQSNPAYAQKGIDALVACYNLNPENPNVVYYLSMAYQMVGNTVQAQQMKMRLQELQGQ